MDKDWLETQLAAGRSIESIAREVASIPPRSRTGRPSSGSSPSTSRGTPRRASPAATSIAELVEEGLTVQQMAERLVSARPPSGTGFAATGLGRCALDRRRMRSRDIAWSSASAAVTATPRGSAAVLAGAFGVSRCRGEAVTARRRRVKRVLIEEAGGCCVLCGYDRFPGALQFHHLDPAEKSFALSVQGVGRSLEKARAEAAKCVLMCANCHAEVEGGVATIRL